MSRSLDEETAEMITKSHNDLTILRKQKCSICPRKCIKNKERFCGKEMRDGRLALWIGIGL